MNNGKPVQSVSLNVGHIGVASRLGPWNECLCMGSGAIFMHGTESEFRLFAADLIAAMDQLCGKAKECSDAE